MAWALPVSADRRTCAAASGVILIMNESSG
jgi:hypothetical protein